MQTTFDKNLLNTQTAIYLLISMHLAGFIGLKWETSRALFESLVFFNLIVSTGLLLYFHQEWSKPFIFFLCLAYFTGYFVELVGVETKIIFGEYWYDTALGWKIAGVPILIGCNWFILVYTTGIIGNFLSNQLWIKILIGAALMVGLDVLIEPVAIKYHFWSWKDGVIPLQNYIAWFIVSAFLLLLFHQFQFKKENPVAFVLFTAQFLFFLLHNIFN